MNEALEITKKGPNLDLFRLIYKFINGNLQVLCQLVIELLVSHFL